MQTDKIHRRSNGTIDIDAYRKEASALRTQTFKRFGRVATECLLRLTTAFVKYTHEKRSFLPRNFLPALVRLNRARNELMGRHSWFNSKYF